MDTKWWFRSLNASLHLSFYSRENWDRKRFYLRSCSKEVVPGLRYCDPEVTVIQAQVTYWFRVCPSTHLVRGEIASGKQTLFWPGISVRCDCFIRTAMPVALNVVCILRDVPPGVSVEYLLLSSNFVARRQDFSKSRSWKTRETSREQFWGGDRESLRA